MGGENSGRRPDVIKMAKEQFDKGFIEFKGEAPWVEIPNYSGLKPAVLKTSPAAISGSHGADGAVQFAKDGGFLSDNSNFHWDDTNNRLGIGTASPAQKLMIQHATSAAYSSTSATTLDGIRIYNSDTTAEAGSALQFTIGATNTSAAAISAVRDSDNNSSLRFQTESANVIGERMRITSGGNVGIGTTSPSDILTVQGADAEIRLIDSDDTTNYLSLVSTGSQSKITHTEGAGNSVLDLNVNVVSPSTSDVRLFRETNTTGRASFQVLKADGTTSVNTQLTASGDSYLNALTGNVGIGTTSPTTLLDVSGSITLRELSIPTAVSGSVKFFASGSDLWALNGFNQTTRLTP